MGPMGTSKEAVAERVRDLWSQWVEAEGRLRQVEFAVSMSTRQLRLVVLRLEGLGQAVRAGRRAPTAAARGRRTARTPAGARTTRRADGGSRR